MSVRELLDREIEHYFLMNHPCPPEIVCNMRFIEDLISDLKLEESKLLEIRDRLPVTKGEIASYYKGIPIYIDFLDNVGYGAFQVAESTHYDTVQMIVGAYNMVPVDEKDEIDNDVWMSVINGGDTK